MDAQGKSIGWATAIIVVLCMGLTWATALVAESSARVLTQTLARMGGELPSITASLVALMKIHMHWLAAAIVTLILIVLLARRTPLTLHGCVAALILSTALAVASLLSLTAPIALCGDLWPDWPSAGSQSSTPKTATPAVACR